MHLYTYVYIPCKSNQATQLIHCTCKCMCINKQYPDQDEGMKLLVLHNLPFDLGINDDNCV